MALPSVDDICTESDLVMEVGGDAGRLERAMKTVAARDWARATALKDVLAALATRSPPVQHTDLADVTELKQAVCYRALSKIFVAGMAKDGDIHDILAQRYEREYQAAVRSQFTLSTFGETSPGGYSFRMERR